MHNENVQNFLRVTYPTSFLIELNTQSFNSIAALEAGKKNVVTKIIAAKGTDVLKSFDRLGQQPLHYCIANHNMEMAKYFLQKGADLNAKDKTGWTPLHVCICN